MTNQGRILIGSASNGSGTNDFGSFTIKGNYLGENGTIVFGTVLASDASSSDRLVIEGDTAGQSFVKVNNIHGLGAATAKGIELIDVQGRSDGKFKLQGRAVAGAYEYHLYEDADGDWYLRSGLMGGGNGGNGGNGSNGGIVRPEVGSYLANIATVNNLFTHQLSDRMLQSVGADGRNTWVRIVGNHSKFKDSTGQLSTTTDNQAIQVGGDMIAQQLASNGLIKFGAMFGYGHTKSSTRSYNIGARSTSSGDGYTLGLYGTWFQNSAELSGAYIDSWLQYVHFDNKVKGDYLQNESYKAKGFIASVEAGYTFKLSPSLYLQPQAQVVLMNVKADDHREYNGTLIRSGGQGNIQSRLGAKLFGESNLSNGVDLRYYAELNWLHNTKSYYVDMDGTRINQRGAKNIGQMKIGLNAQFNKQLSVWGDLSHDIGKNSYRNTKVSIGLKYNF